MSSATEGEDVGIIASEDGGVVVHPVVVFGDISTMVQSPTIDPIILDFEEEEDKIFYDGTTTDDQSIGSSTGGVAIATTQTDP